MTTITLKLVVEDDMVTVTNKELEEVLSRFSGYCYEWSNQPSTKKEISAYNDDLDNYDGNIS